MPKNLFQGAAGRAEREVSCEFNETTSRLLHFDEPAVSIKINTRQTIVSACRSRALSLYCSSMISDLISGTTRDSEAPSNRRILTHSRYIQKPVAGVFH